MTGSREGEKCKQDLLIEGPGLNGYIWGEGYTPDKWANSVTNDCLELDNDYPLRVYTTPDLSYNNKFPIDGVVRNVVFTETATDATIVSPCSEIEPTAAPTTAAPEPPATTTTAAPEPECGCYAPDEEIQIENDKCVMNLGSPDILGDWTFSFELKINSLPDGPTDPRWFFYIISGIGLYLTKIFFSKIISFINIRVFYEFVR